MGAMMALIAIGSVIAGLSLPLGAQSTAQGAARQAAAARQEPKVHSEASALRQAEMTSEPVVAGALTSPISITISQTRSREYSCPLTTLRASRADDGHVMLPVGGH
jgi:hypothetical protein